jgi:hypothetical protein
MAEIVKEFEPGPGNAGCSWLESEDYWAVLLGFTLLVVGLLIYWPSPPDSFQRSVDQYNAIMAEESAKAPFQTLPWYQASRAKGKIRATSQDFAKSIKRWTAKPHGWSNHPLESFVLSKERAAVYSKDAKLRLEESSDASWNLELRAREGENLARGAGFADLSRNAAAERAIREYIRDLRVRGNKLKKIDIKAYNQLGYLVGFGFSLALLFAVGVQVMSGKGSDFLKGFGLVYLLAVTAYFIAGQADVKAMGIGYAAWAITLGLMISNTVGTPTWAKPAVQVEFYIKTGLVLLGAEILFGKILTIGIPGIFVAWVVTPIVFSLLYQVLGDDMGTVMINHGSIDGWSKIFRGWFFCLAFVSIGLSTDFKMLGRHLAGGKPVILYVCGQSFNLLLILLMAYLMFFVVFPNITARI